MARPAVTAVLIAPDLYLTYIAACIALIIVPGPSVSVIIANALVHGPRAGLANVAGTQAGLVVMLAVLVVGLASIIETMAWWFDWLRLAGALYLIWLGWKMLRARGPIGNAGGERRRGSGFFWQGFMVVLANPKALLFFGAFIPQFIDPQSDYIGQTIFLGLTFIALAAILDGGYALAAGRAGNWLSAARVRLASRIGGLFLIAGGIWLAALRR